MHSQKLTKISYLLLIVVMLVTLGCGRKGAKDVALDAEDEQVSMAEIKELKLVPVSTFERTCARCHGPQGAFYGDEFAKLNDAELRKIVKQMMVGPSFLKPKSYEVDAMTAYHRALTAKEPFLCVTSYAPNEQTKTAMLAGEATPESTIEFHSRGEQKLISPDEQGAWSITDAPLAPFKLIVILDDKNKEISIPGSQWTHSVNK
ncbi:MAG: c-type cytochrome [Planctomycetota bacterium]|jgi:cytochrome c553